MKRWEFGLADKIYVGDPQLLTEFKGRTSALARHQVTYNRILQFYRARVKHCVTHITKGHTVFKQKWKGQFKLIDAITKICVHLYTLEMLFEGPKYDMFGPWPHHPSE